MPDGQETSASSEHTPTTFSTLQIVAAFAAYVFLMLVFVAAWESAGAEPPPRESLRYAQGEVVRCGGERKARDRRPERPERIQLRFRGDGIGYVSTPGTTTRILEACAWVNSNRDHDVRVAFSPGSSGSPPTYEDWTDHIEDREAFWRQHPERPVAFPYIWEITIDGTPLPMASYEVLSNLQADHTARSRWRAVIAVLVLASGTLLWLLFSRRLDFLLPMLKRWRARVMGS